MKLTKIPTSLFLNISEYSTTVVWLNEMYSELELSFSHTAKPYPRFEEILVLDMFRLPPYRVTFTPSPLLNDMRLSVTFISADARVTWIPATWLLFDTDVSWTCRAERIFSTAIPRPLLSAIVLPVTFKSYVFSAKIKDLKKKKFTFSS